MKASFFQFLKLGLFLALTSVFWACEEDEIAPPPGLIIDPVVVTIDELNSGQFEGLLVKLEDVQFNEAAGTLFNGTNSNANGSRTLADCNNKTAVVFTATDKEFSNLELPRGNGDLVGIASSFGSTVQLLLRGPEDWADLTGGRCGEIANCPATQNGFATVCSLRNAFLNGASTVPSSSTIQVLVTSDRAGGNVNSRNIIVEDETAGIVVRFAADHAFDAGDVVNINLSGLSFEQFNGLLQVSNVPLANATTAGTETLSPAIITIPQLNSGAFESRLVTLENITYVEAGQNFYGGSGSGTNRNITDGSNTAVVRIGSASAFGDETIPAGPVNLTGNAGIFNGTVQLLPRNAEDVGANGGGGGGEPSLETIANVRALFAAGGGVLSDNNSEVLISQNIKIAGVVISDWTGGNVNGGTQSKRNFVIQDATAGLTIRLSANVSGDFPFALGDAVEILLQGQKLSPFGSQLQIEDIPIDKVSETGTGTLPAPQVISIAQLNTGNFDAQLIRIDGVRFTTTPGTYSGNQTFSLDGTATPLGTCRTNTSTTTNPAPFASTALPTGVVNLTGIAGVNGTTFQIQPRNASDLP
ncbi:MAG: hypothetical protein HC913_11200 [Microscillaceae bacterium]|nr:hypothetical protein [Microscillaceae bacterium]